MNRYTYLARPDIRAFIDWTTSFVTGERRTSPAGRPTPCGCHAEEGHSDGLAAVCAQRRTAPVGDPVDLRQVLDHVNESAKEP